MPASSPPSNGLSADLDLLPLGPVTPVGSATVFRLLRSPEAWVVHTGAVDVFALAMGEGQPVAPRHHLFRVEPGGAFFGMGLPDPAKSSPIRLLAVPAADTTISVLDLASPVFQDSEPAAVALARRYDLWVSQMVEAVMHPLLPRDITILRRGETQMVAAGDKLCAERHLLWVEGPGLGLTLAGVTDPDPAIADSALAVTERAWVGVATEGRVVSWSTEDALLAGRLGQDITALFRRLANHLLAHLETSLAQERRRLTRRVDSDGRRVEGALSRVVGLLSPHNVPPTAVEDPTADRLFSACAIVADWLGFTLTPPRLSDEELSRHADVFSVIAVAARVRIRRITLGDDWWRHTSGPFVGALKDGNLPVALLPKGRGYLMVDPRTGERVKVDARVAARLSDSAHMLYRPLPDQRVNARQLWRYAMHGRGKEMFVVFAAGICSALIGLATPVATGWIFDFVIPGAEFAQLEQIVFLLMAGTIGTALFSLAQSLTLLRVQGITDGTVQAAVMDRLMALPVAFFRNYTAGDLANRALGINSISSQLSGVTLSTVFSGMFSLFSFGLMLWYDWKLSLVGGLIVVIALIGALWLVYLQLRFQRPLYEIQGVLAGKVLQFLSGIAKLRVAGAESRAFANWAHDYAEQNRLSMGARVRGYRESLFASLMSQGSTIIIFAVMALWLGKLGSGDFVAFNSAYGQFFAGMMGLTGALAGSMSVIPLYERSRPILDSLPETDDRKAYPGDLTGRIDIDRVSFRYDADGPLILDDINITIAPGEFVAFVGPSGAGKSTVFRLLMGFEKPAAGTVSYDHKDLDGLDLRSVRRQIGVVLQNGQLLPGSIFQNIVGNSPYTLDDAWEAARLAGLEDDIKAMPMGMETVISEGAATFSGGQRQRLMIARAVVRKPRILLFDEATSALDNATQRQVSDALDQLKATRVVIAHRLSTIVHADRIYVIRAGQVVQSGTYAELVAVEGEFAELARRQLA